MDLTAMRPICCSAFASKSLLGLSWQQWECRTLRTPSQKSPWPAFFPGSAGFPGSGNFLGPPPPRLENVVAGKKNVSGWKGSGWKKKGSCPPPSNSGFQGYLQPAARVDLACTQKLAKANPAELWPRLCQVKAPKSLKNIFDSFIQTICHFVLKMFRLFQAAKTLFSRCGWDSTFSVQNLTNPDRPQQIPIMPTKCQASGGGKLEEKTAQVANGDKNS